MILWKFKKRIEIDKKIGGLNISTFHYGGFDKKGKHKNWTELHCWYECDCENCPLSWETRNYEGDCNCGCYMAEPGEDCPKSLLICMLPRWIKKIIYKKCVGGEA